MTVKLHCPNFWGFERFYADTLKAPQDFKRENTEIAAAYGCFPGQLWNGGRPQNSNKLANLKRIEQEFEIYHNRLNIPIELTFNNLVLDKTDFKDEYCNEIAKIAEKYDTTCTVALTSLRDYLRKNYPRLKIKRSCVACEDGQAWSLDDWDFSVLDQFEGGNQEILSAIPVDCRNKIEIVADVECKDGCKLFYEHHRCSSECQKQGFSSRAFKCPLAPYYMPIYYSRLQKHYVSPEKALEYSKNGFEHFKLVSRCNIGQAIHEICFYYFKPEYVDDCVARSYTMFGVPMRVGVPINYSLYFQDDDPLKGVEDVG